MSVRYHISEFWCNRGGRLDYGALPSFEQAAQEVARRLGAGERGGCRCKPGWSITPCGNLTSDHAGCQPYDAQKFNCEEEE